MPFTKAHASIAADMLSDDARRAMRIMRKVEPAGEMPLEAIQELIDLGFMKNDVNLLGGESILTLTSNGKKVADALASK